MIRSTGLKIVIIIIMDSIRSPGLKFVIISIVNGCSILVSLGLIRVFDIFAFFVMLVLKRWVFDKSTMMM